MRIHKNTAYLSNGRKIGTVIQSGSHGYIATITLDAPSHLTAAGSGETEIEALDNARERIWSQIDQAGTVLRVLLAEIEDYKPSAIRRDINDTLGALEEAVQNVETLKAKLVRLGVKTDRAERLEETVKKTRNLVSNLS